MTHGRVMVMVMCVAAGVAGALVVQPVEGVPAGTTTAASKPATTQAVTTRTAVDRARVAQTVLTLQMLETALNAFEVDNGRVPTTGEGLDALVAAPAGLANTWHGPYLNRGPTDAWGRSFIYKQPGPKQKPYDLFSAGPDGVVGTADDITPETVVK